MSNAALKYIKYKCFKEEIKNKELYISKRVKRF